MCQIGIPLVRDNAPFIKVPRFTGNTEGEVIIDNETLETKPKAIRLMKEIMAFQIGALFDPLS